METGLWRYFISVDVLIVGEKKNVGVTFPNVDSYVLIKKEVVFH